MRATSDLPGRRGIGGRRTGLIAVAVIAVLLLTSLRGLARFYTDYLWFDEVSLAGVWRGVLGAKVLLGVLFTALFFAVLWLNLWLADRMAPPFRALSPEDEIIERYRDIVGERTALVRIVVSAAFALIAGAGASSQWNTWILYRNRVDFGSRDALFGRDAGFYVFQLPFMSFVIDWLFVALIIISVVTLAAHYLNGGVRLQPMPRVAHHVRAHLSVLLGLVAFVKAADYWLARYELNFSTRGFRNGPMYTDVKAQLPALNLLVFISIIAGVLLLANLWVRRGWLLPALAVGLWALMSLLIGSLYPAFVQKFRVEPSENAKEKPYIERNIAATREALGLDSVETEDYPYDTTLDAEGLAANAETIRNVRLWDPNYTQRTYQRLQGIKQYYSLSDIDIDRYEIDGRKTQALVSVREVNSDDLPNSSWVSRHLVYTHGYGAVVSPANAVTSDGKPAFTLSNVPPEGQPPLEQPRVYFAEQGGGYAIVNTKEKELDFQDEGGRSAFTAYSGEGGVPLSSLVRRASFALRFGTVNPLISNLITDDSKALFNRDIRTRITTAAPFLAVDADPYPVLLDGRILWVQDAYTTTDRFPAAQGADVRDLDNRSGLKRGFNYARNSVKITIDAYDGTMNFYVVDETDPIVKAYSKAFPELFTDASEIPDGLREHFRYPEDLFRVQTAMYARYHIDNASDFYNAGDAWNVSPDPGSGQVRQTTAPSTSILPGGVRVAVGDRRMDPSYVQLRLPGDDEEKFILIQTFVPAALNDSNSQPIMTAFMTASSNPEDYGKLRVFTMPRGQSIDGPLLVDNTINADPDISRELSLLDQRGSQVVKGNILVIPIENSLLFVRPLYVQSERSGIPEFQKAIVVFNGRAEMRNTLQEALVALFGEAPDTLEAKPSGGGEEPPPDAPDESISELLAQIAKAYDEAQAALREGDLATYQRKVDEMARLNARAREESSPSSTTTTTAPPSA
jgi:uncharacterized protein